MKEVLSLFGVHFWGLSVLYTLGAALFIGIPTVLIPNQWFTRMTPTSLQDYLIWGITALLVGPVLALATLFPSPSPKPSTSTGVRAITGTVLSFFSVGCPVCNKLVVFLLGFTGAMTFFDPLRPYLGIMSIVLLSVTLFLRVRALKHGCQVRFDSSLS